MGLFSYPEELSGVMKLLNNCITGSSDIQIFRKAHVKDQTSVDFIQEHYKDSYNKLNNIKGDYHFSTVEKNIIGQ